MLSLRTSTKPLAIFMRSQSLSSESGIKPSTSWWAMNTWLDSSIARSCSFTAFMRSSWPSARSFATRSCELLLVRAWARKPVSSAISRKAVTRMPTVWVDQLSGMSGGLIVEEFRNGATAPICNTQTVM